VLSHLSGAGIYLNHFLVLMKLQWKQYGKKLISPSTFTRGGSITELCRRGISQYILSLITSEIFNEENVKEM
jgi:hypothetical protein